MRADRRLVRADAAGWHNGMTKCANRALGGPYSRGPPFWQMGPPEGCDSGTFPNQIHRAIGVTTKADILKARAEGLLS